MTAPELTAPELTAPNLTAPELIGPPDRPMPWTRAVGLRDSPT